MTIHTAEWDEVQKQLHETYGMWSPGLSRQDYVTFIWNQIHHFWSRRNYRYVAYKDNGEVLSTCKFYSLDFASRGKSYRVWGIGAVFTSESKRGKGYAAKMLREITFKAKDMGYQGLMLYSDIGAPYYQNLDFIPLQCRDFWIELNQVQAPASTGSAYEIRPVQLSDIPFLYRHYARWLRRQPYGIDRSEKYMHYKLTREIYLHENSRWNWPRLELVKAAAGDGDGYAIIEYAGKVLRVLEIIGTEPARLAIWDELVRIAHQRTAKKMRGWEGQAPKHLPVTFNERNWGLPMMLPLSPEMQSWTQCVPFQLLELDHI